MEKIEVPLWLITTFGVGIVSWLAWLTLKSHANEKAIEINNANDRRVNDELIRINASIEKLEKRMEYVFEKFEIKVNGSIEKLDRKLDRIISKKLKEDEDE